MSSLETRAVIEKYDIRAKKKYGQNFLTDDNILNKIVDASEVTSEDLVLEIGPGTGNLTDRLCQRAGMVIAVEIDRKLIPALSDRFSDTENLQLINADIMKTDLNDLLDSYPAYKKRKIVANLPYYITTPVIMHILEAEPGLESVTVMIQKEVADRIKAGPSTKDYGSLSLAVQYFSKPVMVCEVPPSCFFPQPKVGSAVMRFDIYKERPVRPRDQDKMFAIIRGSFNQRRKTLANGLKNYAGLDLTREEIESAIDRLGKKPTVRGEELTLEEFAVLSDLL